MSRAMLRVPDTVAAGAVFTVKVLIRHPMESGHGRDRMGEPIPRNIIHTLRAEYAGAEVFRAELLPGIAANPYLEFRVRARSSGDIVLTWSDDEGNTVSQSVALTVT